jgi:hypothetical protein
MTNVVNEVARKYMAHKGHPGIVPTLVEKVDDEDCWYYTYDLDDGNRVELEVDYFDGEWHFTTMLLEDED